MMKKFIQFNIILLCLFCSPIGSQVFGQQSMSGQDAGEGFTMPSSVVYDTPEKLPGAINSEAEESMPVLSADGKTLYFVRMLHPDNLGGKFSGHDIWFSKLQADSSWGEPKNNLYNLNNKGNNAIIGFNKSGKEVYLLNHYGTKDSRHPGISVAQQDKTNWWSLPEDLDIPKLKKDGFFYNAYVNKKGNIAIVSMKTRRMPGDEDLFITTKDEEGKWSKLISLGHQINTPGFEITPFLSEDEKTLYFSSNGHKGFGDSDIYRSHRQDSSWTNWSKPENLGRPINSKGFDAAYFEHENGTVLFISNRGDNLADLYSSRIRNSSSVDEEQLLAEQGRLEEEELEAERRRREAVAERKEKENEEEVVLDRIYPLTVSIYFAFDSHELSAKSKNELSEIFHQYTDGEDVRVELIGHTDAIGTPQYNEKLSIKRAKAAEDYLISAGLAEERVQTEGRGEQDPVASNETPEGRRQNRRVKIVVVK